MSWFEEQLKYRRESDDQMFSDSLESIAGAVMGERLRSALDSREAAASAIDEVLRYYRCKSKNAELPPELKTLEDQLDYRMRPFGIMRRTVLLDKGWYRCAVGPMLGTLKDSGAAVALIPGTFSGYSWLDLSTGKRVKLTRKTEGLLDEEALCFYKPLPLRALTMTDLLKFTVSQLNLSDILLYVGLMGLGTLLGLLSPVFTRLLFGSVLESGSVRVLLALAGFMLGYQLCSVLMGAYRSLSSSRIGIKQNIAVQAAVMARILSLPASFFKEYASGELTQRSGYVQSLCSMLMSTIGTTGLSAVFSLIYLGQIFSFAPSLVVPSLIITLLTLTVTVCASLAQMRISREQMQLSAKTSGLTYAQIRGIQKIKLAGAEKRMFARWARQYAKEASLSYNPPLFLKLSGTITMTISLLGSLVLYGLAVKSHVSVADYYAFNASYGMISGAFGALAGLATTFANIKPSLEMARPILEAEPEVSEDKEIVTSLRGSIELNDVSFRYDDSMPWVIDGLSLRIKNGEYVAIVGSTGCGKSTLLRLLLGFEKPQKGSIFYDRKDLSRLDLRSVRKMIGVVMQDGKLFLGDIFSNIVIAAPELGLDAAWEAAEIASIADDIRKMPMGMNTVISEGQGGISGGQRQRLMIARAVAAKPKILMFDEATSALDNVTQKKVSEAIDALNCTRIVIAHRLSTIRHCDRIIVLDKGRIVEDGTYEELLEKKGFFAELVERQRLDVETD